MNYLQITFLWLSWFGTPGVPSTIQRHPHAVGRPSITDKETSGVEVSTFLARAVTQSDVATAAIEGKTTPVLPENIMTASASCDEDYWLCSDKTQCIPKNHTCSGVAECDDESDEAVGLCGCLSNEYQCPDVCINNLRRCDTVRDCEGGEDELFCETWVCPESHFKCTNGFCVPLDAVCDFVDDCRDASDEHECSYRPCFYAEFRCANGECIRPGLVCDGVEDCVDGSDEMQCQQGDWVSCGSGRQVHRFFWCDGWPDCTDNHADELNCGPCKESELRCNDGQCIPKGNHCDAQCDCVDCADEQGCQTYDLFSGTAICRVSEAITCVVDARQRAKDRCLSAGTICDGFNHCHNGEQVSDETGCENANAKCLLGKDDWAGEQSRPSRFLCSDGRCLPGDVVCNRRIDCLDGEDEADCPEIQCNEEDWQCSSGECVSQTSRCDLKFDCADKSDELNCENQVCGEGESQCWTGHCIPASLWCDHVTDCLDNSDELHCHHGWNGCQESEFACASVAQCIPLEQRCILSTNRHHGCADRSHLLGCKSKECPPGMFKCRSGPCLEAERQCDGNIDCPETWDDEDFCPFQCSQEVPECRCHHLEANCSGLNLRRFPDIEKNINRFYFADNQLSSTLHAEPVKGYQQAVFPVNLSRNHLRFLNSGTFSSLWRLRILILSDNDLAELTNGAFAGLHTLRNLRLDGNQITVIKPLAFYGLSSLPTLDLSHQRLREIGHRAFLGLRNLTTLIVSDNDLTSLDEAVFTGLRNLQKLDLTKNQLAILSKKTFQSLSLLSYLATDEWRWCCLVDHVETCLPETDQFSSCEDLMSNAVLRVCIWILGLIALFGNAFVIFWRSIYSSGNKVHSFLIVNLAFADFLMGVYLLIVAVVDLQYRGVYAAYEVSWRSSSLCQVAGFISTFSSELSVFTLTVITVDRFMVIKFPFGGHLFDGEITKQVMGGVWVLVTLLAALPLTHLDYFKNFYGRSGVCLPLHITNEKPNGWEYAVFIFLALNLLSFVVIAVSYALMYTVTQEIRMAALPGPVARPGESGMATRMTLIVATDAACWLPIIVLGIASLCGVAVPPKVFSWIAVFVLPLNAAVNPVLYTLSTSPVRKRFRSLRQRFCAMWSRKARPASLESGNPWASYRTRIEMELTDSPMPSETEVRVINTKSSIRTSSPVLLRSPAPVMNANGPSDLGAEGSKRVKRAICQMNPGRMGELRFTAFTTPGQQ
ncbi:G-protein coupled receptor GRL101-like [Macrobrachium nipponense]|uniref:G-protein coupled receptor GRL101-like n=1 Tax=Macrobrachium nipponense TaxID=159736 RepID=UPI0030C83445